MRITLTGATGFIGGRLVSRLLAGRHELNILSRHPRAGSQPRYFPWDSTKQDAPAKAFENVDAVIHLAGEPVAQRWNSAAKERIRASRVEGTRRIVRAMADQANTPQVLVSASAIGIYGSRGDEILTESSAAASGFLEDVTSEWERAAITAAEFGTRVASIRIGIVLGRGGALKEMLPPFRAGLGGRLGSGKQWMSWIHVDDLVELLVFSLGSHQASGALNGTSPNPVTNADFTRELARALHRPAIMPVPEFALKLLFGEMAGVMLASQRVLPEAALRAGFEFQYPRLDEALRQIVGGHTIPDDRR